MLTVIFIMILGIATGYAIKNRKRLIRVNERLTTWAIYVLLLLMGLGIGANKVITNSLHTLGIKALLISVGGITGSIVLGWVTYKLFFKQKRQ